MSRASRPRRRVRGAAAAQLLAAALALIGWRGGLCRWRGLSLRYVAGRWRCRPAHLRRCLRGKRVSAHAAARILRRAA